MMRVRDLVGVSVFAIMMTAKAATAADYYVAPDGWDGAPGSAWAPFQTVNYGVAFLAPGDTLWVRGGVYDESLMYNVPSGTSWENKVTVAAYPGEIVTLRPTAGSHVLGMAGDQGWGSWGEQKSIEIDGVNLDGSAGIAYDTVKIDSGPGYDAHHIRLQNLVVIGNPYPVTGHAQAVLLTSLRWDSIGSNEFRGLVVTGGPTSEEGNDFSSMFYVQSPDNLIENCVIYDGIGAGIQLYNGNWPGSMPDRTIIRNNVITSFVRATSTRGYGIIAARGDGHEIYGNVVSEIMMTGGSSGGIYLYGETSTQTYDNTAYDNAGFGIVADNPSTNQMWNNVSYQNGRD